MFALVNALDLCMHSALWKLALAPTHHKSRRQRCALAMMQMLFSAKSRDETGVLPGTRLSKTVLESLFFFCLNNDPSADLHTSPATTPCGCQTPRLIYAIPPRIPWKGLVKTWTACMAAGFQKVFWRKSSGICNACSAHIPRIRCTTVCGVQVAFGPLLAPILAPSSRRP
jgi:hypothetical protein